MFSTDDGEPVSHAHGQHSIHTHTAADYAAHQLPIDEERFPGDDVPEPVMFLGGVSFGPLSETS